MKTIRQLGNVFFVLLIIAVIAVYTYGRMKDAEFMVWPGAIIVIAALLSWYRFRKLMDQQGKK